MANWTDLKVPVNPLQSSNEIMQNAKDHDGTISVSGIPSIITWNYEGKYVAIEGSWDNWKTRDLMQKSGKDFSILKLLPSGVYHYHFIVDGEVRYSPDLPLENDDFGNIYNVLDLQNISSINITSLGCCFFCVFCWCGGLHLCTYGLSTN
ncbi:unnamed protein product [Thlaspi arvense]|uniref:AMP-activated protein kinase glycogen-binding domain-containing protein n=1 Tax=Thlaspi arvense TaxID=13288 RepID=A0AAU9SHX8_THLAR|nr:unnamed protein product [Thlaspi arvense]